jgi:sugar/nucleoside kinase (ribokinase family)
VVVAGNLSLDDTSGPEGSLEEAPGGDALYASLAVQAWGASAALLTLVGDDYPSRYLDRILSAGIDLTHVRATDGPTVHYRVTNDEDGSRIYEWISAPERLLETSPAPADYDAAFHALAGTDRLHVDWLHLAAMPIEAQEAGVAAGRSAGVPVSLDPHEEYVVGFEDRIRQLVEGTAFMPSELEVRLLFPGLAADHAGDPVAFAFAAAEHLDEWRPALVVIKLGALGSVVRAGGRTAHIPALSVPVVDSTGAGDAFCGGFVVGWLATGDPRVAAACGTVSAAGTIGAFGAFRSEPARPKDLLDRLGGLLAEVASGDADESALREAAEPLRRAVGIAQVTQR